MWASTTRIRIASALYYELHQSALFYIDGGMDRVLNSGQQAIDYVEGLLDQLDAVDSLIATGSASANLIQADVLKWSDHGGDSLTSQRVQRDLIAIRIASSLGLSYQKPNPAKGGHGRLIRS